MRYRWHWWLSNICFSNQTANNCQWKFIAVKRCESAKEQPTFYQICSCSLAPPTTADPTKAILKKERAHTHNTISIACPIWNIVFKTYETRKIKKKLTLRIKCRIDRSIFVSIHLISVKYRFKFNLHNWSISRRNINEPVLVSISLVFFYLDFYFFGFILLSFFLRFRFTN